MSDLLTTLVRHFHEAYRHPIAEGVNAPYHRNRADWIEEELREYREAIESGDLVAQLDALGDIIYLATGSFVALGYYADPIVREIHRSNMTKLFAEGPRWREDGKVLKGPNFEDPDIPSVMVELVR